MAIPAEDGLEDEDGLGFAVRCFSPYVGVTADDRPDADFGRLPFAPDKSEPASCRENV